MKAQAAMEFLMTYGWAILVVLVVIGALGYVGVLNPKSILPSRCSINVGFDCLDYRLTPSEFTLLLENKVGRVVNVTDIVLTQKTGSGMCSNTSMQMQMENGASATVLGSCIDLLDTGSKISIKMNMTYFIGEAQSYPHYVTGELFVEIGG